MSGNTAQDVVDAAMAMPEAERASLALRLLDSLGEPALLSREQIDAAWNDEIERRVAELEAGQVDLIDANDAIRRARASLRR